MTKRDLVVKVSYDTDIVQTDVQRVIEEMMKQISDAMRRGERVDLRNFGNFSVRLRKSRKGRNPHKPEDEVVIPERTVVKFKPGREMSKKVSLLQVDENSLISQNEKSF